MRRSRSRGRKREPSGLHANENVHAHVHRYRDSKERKSQSSAKRETEVVKIPGNLFRIASAALISFCMLRFCERSESAAKPLSTPRGMHKYQVYCSSGEWNKRSPLVLILLTEPQNLNETSPIRMRLAISRTAELADRRATEKQFRNRQLAINI